MAKTLRVWALPIALLAIATASSTWLKLISTHVPHPYLDEIFHIPQAQRYCKSDWAWDPKITTPPGLYLLSILFKPFFGGCDTSMLRALNVGAICLIFLASYSILKALHSSQKSGQTEKRSKETTQGDHLPITSITHSAFNISLFPPLFFFSGLYYTDVLSTLIVLINYNTFVNSKTTDLSTRHILQTVTIGVVALLFRQTNIFWVAIFPAGLAVVDSLKGSTRKNVKTYPLSILDTLGQSWQNGLVHDVPIEQANLQDCILFPLSLGIAAIRCPFKVLRAALPYGIILILFAAFVAWNGGVVLGDKSNHVATIHTPQMLYLWPYIAFFSLPLLIAPVAEPVIRLMPQGKFKSYCLANLTGTRERSLPGLLPAVLSLCIGLAAVHYNTIVHPFTLADNRHYTFYVFRILFRHPAIKYIAVLVYYVCAWLGVQALEQTSTEDVKSKARSNSLPPVGKQDGLAPCQVSFIFIWVVTTALSVVSTSLVEPRYFIIPWVMWRLHVSTIVASRSKNASYDMRLWLETVWHIIIQTTVGYLFLYRGFSWPSDPAEIQRFLW